MGDPQRPLLVMIHGWGFDSGVFQSLVEKLDAPYRIQRINLPGYGNQDIVSEYSLSHLSSYLNGKVTEPAIYLAWSMGGLIALKLAETQPDKVKSLILITSTPCFAKQEKWPNAMERSILKNFILAYNKEPELTLDKFSYLATEGSHDPRNWIRELKKLSEAKVAPAALEQGLQILLNTDSRKSLKDLKIPTLMIFGEKDTLVPVAVEKEIVALNKTIKTKIIPGAGHTPFLTDTDLVAEAIHEHIAG